MSTTRSYPSYVACVAEILSSSPEPLDIQTLIQRVQERRPVGKAVKTSVYNALRQLFQAVPVSPGRYGWLSSLLQGQWFRHHLTDQEIQRGLLFLDELEHMVFFPDFFPDQEDDGRRLTLELMGGPTLQAWATVSDDTWALQLGSQFSAWVDDLGGRAQDDLLIWAIDVQGGRYGFRLQPRESRQEEEIARRNLLLARTAEEIVALDRRRQRKEKGVRPWELAAALIARKVYGEPIPPDELHEVLQHHSRLTLVKVQTSPKLDEESRMQGGRADTEETGFEMFYVLDSEAHAAPPRTGSSPSMPSTPEPHPGFVDLSLDPFYSSRFSSDVFEIFGEEELYEWLASEADAPPETCPSYEVYLTEFYSRTPEEDPLSHGDFHLLEAELENLIALEEEFGYLLPEQEARKKALADLLFIDPDVFYRDRDWGDLSDFEDPYGPFGGADF